MSLSRDAIHEELASNAGRIHELGVDRIGLFGSYSRDEATEDSDIDILVRFREGEKTFANFMELKRFLEELFDRDIDLVTEQSVRESIQDRVLKEVEYVEAV
ncbi:MAG: nucleotidyltransferase family protein [Candidatus Nanohaloarchaea archaeon]|nr:nucleotidyltransferase family protein [Candidatus Nanohaloarchaea archaeon]